MPPDGWSGELGGGARDLDPGGQRGESTPAETAPATTAAETPASEGTAAETAAASAPTLQELLDLQDANIVTPDVALLGGADFATGVTTRIPFAVIDKDSGEAVRPDGDTAEVYLAPNAETPAIGPFQATWRSLEVPGAKFDPGIPHAVWTADVPLPAEGPYFLVAAYTVDGQQRSANTGLNVQPRRPRPPWGAPRRRARRRRSPRPTTTSPP